MGGGGANAVVAYIRNKTLMGILRKNCLSFRRQIFTLLKDITSPVHRYSVDFLYSGPSGVLGSDGKQNTAFKPMLGGLRIVALFISSHEQTQ